MDEINIKRLTLVALISWLVSLLYIFAFLTYYPAYHFNRKIEFDFFLLVIYMAFGYGEVLIIYAIAILIIKYISCVVLKRILHFVLWIVIFSCVEFYFIVELLHMRDAMELVEFLLYIPPFLIKILFYIYYKYKEKQDNKRTQLPSK